MWSDPTGLGLLTKITIRSGQQNVKLFGEYWPCANSAEHSFETILSARIQPSPHYTDWRSYFEHMLLDRLHHDQASDSAWTLGGDFNCSLSKPLAMPEPSTLAEWTHSLGLTSPLCPSNHW